jgi:hypothetical protein
MTAVMKNSDRPESLQHFDAEALGISVRQLAVDVVRGENMDFVSRWFRSGNSEVDLVVWADSEKRIIKHQLCFFGQIVDWTPFHGTRTGFVVEEEALVPPGSAGAPDAAHGAVLGAAHGSGGGMGNDDNVSEEIRFDKNLQPAVVAQAIQLLSWVPELSESERGTLVFNLRESPKLHKNARERALKVWAPKVEEMSSTRRSTFWKTLRSWVLGD